MQKIVSWFADIFKWMMKKVVDNWKAHSENRKRHEVKLLAIEELKLNRLLESIQRQLRQAETTSAAPRRKKSIRQNMAAYQRKLYQNRRRQQQLKKLLHGRLDEEPEAASRSLTELLGDKLAALIPSVAANRAHELESLEESITANIQEVEDEREKAKAEAGKAFVRQFIARYFKLDNELVQLKTELVKTQQRVLMLRKAPIAA